MQKIFSIIEENREASVQSMQELCRLESVSARNRGIGETAEAVRRILSGIGAETKIVSAGGSKPSVFGEIKGKSERALLFYNHYDVQPPEPLELWKFPPFSAEIENGRLYARGAADNKGDFTARVSAVKAILQAEGKLPVTVKFFVEGEEEIGSPFLHHVIEKHPESVSADACVWEMGNKTFDGRPIIFLGIKGMLYVELTLKGACRDSHSSLATTVPNPAWKLIWALNSLKDREENIKIPGFYDGIMPLSESEISLIKNIPAEDEKIMADMGLDEFLLGLSGFEKIKRDLGAPTCTICGLYSGYTGEGQKTVLPAEAKAKVDFRLVPGQDPEYILQKLRSHLEKEGFGDIDATAFGMEKPFKTLPDSEFPRIVSDTAEKTYGKAPVVYPIMPATGPMHQICGKDSVPCAGTGIANSKSAIHAPNENVTIDDFIAGIKHAAMIIKSFL